ncbi:ABC transporter family substrate-binding protein [Corynebacterium sp. P3-F1]|uniref:ABC transporter family substrate-binding protein n=1 Tax=Corynebacterium sp. P3-F1 TaxID=3059080 RepID=UPI00265CE25B|nr:ABC transporter family substrate-binding protein [Corynebacterium sp. P3-F1]WKK61276.1 ABC transporter family substrate-binding protein [Corynebacterium sp. P3-F1]
MEEPETTEASTTTAAQSAARTEASVGVQPLRNGLNPHLAADENSTVRDVAELALPSAFGADGINRDLLVSAGILPNAMVENGQTDPDAPAMTVRYVIAPSAQWSDGSPITGADFAYLWRGMVSTPGAVDPAGYRAIRDIRVSGSGKTVDVLFDEPLTTWQELFNYLLPSHLLDSRAADFATALGDTIPASAGRYMVDKVDRGAGVIALKRNDRFWGPDPANIDLLTLNFVRSTNLTGDRLRSGQLAFVDHVPGETSWDAYSLIPGAQLKLVEGPRELGVTLSVNSSILGSEDARKELASLIDVPLVARIAAGRERDLAAAPRTEPLEEEPHALRAAVAESGTLRIAADARDDQAMPAARALADLLVGAGINAEAVAADTAEIATRLRAGTVDAVVGWSVDGGPGVWASKVQCAPQNEQFVSGNISGLCLPSTRSLASDILTGRIPADQAREEVSDTLRRESVWVPLLAERRLMVLGRGITGPVPELDLWQEGVAGAAQWKAERSGVPGAAADDENRANGNGADSAHSAHSAHSADGNANRNKDSNLDSEGGTDEHFNEPQSAAG